MRRWIVDVSRFVHNVAICSRHTCISFCDVQAWFDVDNPIRTTAGLVRLPSQLARHQHALYKTCEWHTRTRKALVGVYATAYSSIVGTLQKSRVAHLGSLSNIEQIAAQYFVLRRLAPAVPWSLLHGDNEARAAPIVSCPNDLKPTTTASAKVRSRQRQAD